MTSTSTSAKWDTGSYSLVLHAEEDGGFARRGQDLEAWSDPVGRARSMVTACPTIAMPVQEGSILLVGAARLETDWGCRHRLTGHAVAETHGWDVPEGTAEVRRMEGGSVQPGRAVERFQFDCGVEVRALA